ncbi:MAG: DUF4926 domain-containing protein [Hyphomicrobiales bacterium]
MIRELDTVALTRPLPEHGLEPGDLGTVVMVHRGGEGYEVEFTTLSGETLAVETLPSEAIRELQPDEIAHARAVLT